MKVDPYNSKDRLESWKNSSIDNISSVNVEYLKNYIFDMEKGLNVASTHKGKRSAIRLLSLASRVRRIMELFEIHYKVTDFRKLTQKQVHDLFSDMYDGTIKKASGESYLDVADYIKRFKSFWHWYMKISSKEGRIVLDLTSDLTAERKHKPKFVYFTKEQADKLIDFADYETKVLISFLFDSGARVTEAMNTRFSDLSVDCKEVSIRDEVAKTFGRKIKLMLSSEILLKYVRDNNFSGDDLLFTFSAHAMNRRLKVLGKKVLGSSQTLGRCHGNELTMYDFRHSSACFWLPRYKSRSALLYRFGWKREEEIHYYTELLGMKDTITDQDMLLAMDKTIIEKEIALLKDQVSVLQDRLDRVLKVRSK